MPWRSSGGFMRRILLAAIICYVALSLFSQEEMAPARHPAPASHGSDAMYDLLFEYSLGIGGGEAGIEADANNIYTSIWNDSLIIRYQQDGTFVEMFSIPGVEHIRDMAYDGTYFYGGASSTILYQMDFTSQILIGTITAPTDVRAIAYDEDNDCFWANNWSTNIIQFDRNGNTLSSYPCGAYGSFYGFAWENILSGGPYLWGYSQDGFGNELVKMDIAAGCIQTETYDIADSGINYYPDNIAGGLFISPELQNYNDYLVIGGVIQGMEIWGLELGWIPGGNVPTAPTNFTAVTDPSGVPDVTLSWTTPTHTIAGNPLTDILEGRLYQDDVLIYTDTNATIGADETYTHVGAPGGMHTYRISYLNMAGGGPPATATLWVGEDVPGAVTNGTLTGNVLSWENPTTGLHNGPFNNPIIGYHLTRSDGVVFELAGIMTSYTDDTIPSPGYYWYEIVPYNSIGDGGSAIIHQGIIPPPMIYEEFNLFPPADWTITGGTNWQGSVTNNAGGLAPEAQFYWSPSTVGIQRLISTPLESDGYYWEFKSMVNDYGGGYTLRFEASADLQNWDTLWEISPSANQGPELIDGFYVNPTPDEPLYFAFTFDGNSFDINYWCVDDLFVLCAPVPDVFPCAGHVALHGGDGVVENTAIHIDASLLFPDENGDFETTIYEGLRTIEATLEHYAHFDTTLFVQDSLWLDVDLWYLEPPINTSATVLDDHVIIEWDVPQTPLFIAGYAVFRDGEEIGITTELVLADLSVPAGEHSYYVCASYEDGLSVPGDTVVVNITDAGISPVPAVTALEGNYPNPFNPETAISFTTTNANEFTTIEVYNIKGQMVKTLVKDILPAGTHSVVWDGKDTANRAVSSGVYLYKMKAGKYQETKKMLLMK